MALLLAVLLMACPPGMPYKEKDIQYFLDKRKPGQSKYTDTKARGR